MARHMRVVALRGRACAEAAKPVDTAVDLDDLHEAPPLPKGVHRMSLSTATQQADAEYGAFVQRVGAAAAPVCAHLDPLKRAQVRPRMLPRMHAAVFRIVRIVSRVLMQDSTFRGFGRGRRGLALPATLFDTSLNGTVAVQNRTDLVGCVQTPAAPGHEGPNRAT